MKWISTIAAVLAIATPHAVNAAEQAPSWLCVADQTTGFAYKNSRWTSVNFSNRKYILKVNTSMAINYCISKNINLDKCPNQTGYEFIDFGDTSGVVCTPKPAGTIVCGDFFHKVVFNKSNLRFMYFYEAGYIDDDTGLDTPHIAIGRCTPL